MVMYLFAGLLGITWTVIYSIPQPDARTSLTLYFFWGMLFLVERNTVPKDCSTPSTRFTAGNVCLKLVDFLKPPSTQFPLVNATGAMLGGFKKQEVSFQFYWMMSSLAYVFWKS